MEFFKNIVNGIRRRRMIKEVAKLRSITVGQLMTKYLITVRAHEEVIKAATKMIAEDISCLLVMENEELVGVLSERDFLRKVPLSTKVFNMKVQDIMRKDPVTCDSHTTVEQAVKIMIEKNVRRLIVTKDNKPLGIVTQTDFTKALRNNVSVYPLSPAFTVDKFMSKEVVAITTKHSVVEVKEKMLKNNVGAILITDKEKDPVPLGIFTEYDVVMQFYDQHGKLDMKDISSYMRKYVRAVPVETSIFEANRLMLEKNMRRLLIVDGTKIAGIVTQTDVCRKLYLCFDAMLAEAQNKNVIFTSLTTALHGEFRGEHLKVYDAE